MQSLKVYLRNTVAIVFFIYVTIQTYTFQRIEWSDVPETRCGTVTFKGNRDQVNKHSTNTEFVLVILYDDTNRKEDETVRAATWSSYNVGDRICLSWDANAVNVMGGVNGVFGMLGSGVFFIALVIGLIAAFMWFFFDYNIFDKKHWRDDRYGHY